jgi:hypothetical protein
MADPVRRLGSLVVLLTLLGTCRATDQGLSRAQIAQTGKPATALVEVKVPGRFGYGSAFCIHSSGLFLTNAHVPKGDITLVLNPGLKTEKSFPARVIRSDKDLDLALLRIDGAKDLPALTLGSDDKLAELMEVVAFGFPFGTALAPGRREYPAISVNVGSITSLRRKDGRLHRIQLDAALNPGNSGGPVLDNSGKVVGVVQAGIQGSLVNFAIPVSTVAGFVARPDIEFDPPLLGMSSIHKPALFEARVTSLLPSAAPLTVDLILKPSKGPERTHRMQAERDKYRVTAVPVPPPPGPLTLRLLAQFDNGKLEASTTDRPFNVGDHEMKVSDVLTVRLGAAPRVLLHDGKRVEGTVSGLDSVPVRLGEQTLSVNLAKAAEVKFLPVTQSDQVSCTLLVKQGDDEVFRQSQSLTDQGLLKNRGFEVGLEGWRTWSDNDRSQFEVDTDVAREGWKSLRLTAADSAEAVCYQEVMLKPEHWYRFSGWVRTRGLKSPGARLSGTYFISHGGGNTAIASGRNYAGDTEWTEVLIPFRAPASGMVRIHGILAAFGKGTGTAWFDDLKLVEVSQVPPTKIARWADPRLGVTDGLELWLDAGRLNAARQARGLDSLKSGDAIETWFDASGHGRSVRQSVAASRPQLVRVGEDWLVRFDGTDNHLRCTGQNRFLSGATVFAVAAPRANPGGFRALLAANEKDQRDHRTGFNIDMGAGATAQFQQLNVEGRGFDRAVNLLDRPGPFNDLHILELVVDPDQRAVRLTLDGKPCGARPCAPAPLSFDEITVGARYFNNGPGPVYVQGMFPGDIAEILVYDRPRTELERRSVRDYLQRKYARLKESTDGKATAGQATPK